jgi:hypothetical protein
MKDKNKKKPKLLFRILEWIYGNGKGDKLK